MGPCHILCCINKWVGATGFFQEPHTTLGAHVLSHRLQQQHHRADGRAILRCVFRHDINNQQGEPGPIHAGCNSDQSDRQFRQPFHFEHRISNIAYVIAADDFVTLERILFAKLATGIATGSERRRGYKTQTRECGRAFLRLLADQACGNLPDDFVDEVRSDWATLKAGGILDIGYSQYDDFKGGCYALHRRFELAGEPNEARMDASRSEALE